MNINFFKKSFPTLIFLGLFSFIALPVFYHLLKVEKKLKIYNPADVNPRLVDKNVKHIQKNHTIANFELINQNGETITNKDYKDKIYIADAINYVQQGTVWVYHNDARFVHEFEVGIIPSEFYFFNQ